MEILLFGGTCEGNELADWLAGRGCGVTLCVATEYGAALAPSRPGVRVLPGRLDGAGMDCLLAGGAFACAVDATHPYAVQVSQTLRAACGRALLPYYRLVRQEQEGEGWIHVPDAAAAARCLEGREGAVLLTTGSKDLPAFARPGLVERCFPRVLPTVESLSRCLEFGFLPAHILCMQGPFSQELNEALIRQYQIQTLVTKSSGAAGGFPEKAAAAAACGCALVLLDRPVQEKGLNLEELKQQLEEKIG